VTSLTRSALARLARVSPDTLRHYERKGVLPVPPRTPNGYRRYPPEALARVQLVRRALVVGFTLAELARVLRERDAGGAPCRKVRDLVASRFAALEQRLEELTALRDDLRQVLDEWDTRLVTTKPGTQARLLDGLATRVRVDRSEDRRPRVVDRGRRP
jgi:DNA-binding transcriptional MerR regulator